MTPRDSALLVVARLALADGKIDSAEEEFLEQLLAESDSELSVNALLAVAENRKLDEILKDVSKYEDRFFIALRAYLMAHVDWEYDAKEETLFKKLVKLLEITPEDLKIIKKTERDLRSPEEREVNARISELYKASSFYRPES